VTGGPCEGSLNPQICVAPIPLAIKIVSPLEEYIRNKIRAEEVALVACWGFHAGVPSNNYVAYADFLLDVKTIKPEVREKILELIEERIRQEDREAKTLKEPVFNYSVRALLISNDAETTAVV
jgi:metal-dependent amidase/aminoacylase/carboxypeptidase family protein